MGIIKPIDDGIGIVIASSCVKKYTYEATFENLNIYKVLSDNKIINLYEGQITHLTASNIWILFLLVLYNIGIAGDKNKW